VKYAQRNDSIYVTIECADVKNEKIDLTEDSLSFKGNSSGRDYVMDVKLFKKINVEESITKILPRSIQIFMKKAEAEDEYWPRMLEDKNFEKKHFKIDWDKWKDEDDDDAEAFDQSQLAGGD
ncbi:HSP20-like chaperone, partial [Baffinella frigidus]